MSIPSIFKRIELKIADSTSAEMHRRIESGEGVPSGTVITAEEQTCGRGQGDHLWHSEGGRNLTFSLYLRYCGDFSLKVKEQLSLTQACSLAVVDFLEEMGVDARIKEPNDVWVDGKKICGILIENGIRGEMMDWSIIGIGLNVNQIHFPPELPNPTSLAIQSGREYDLEDCLEKLLQAIKKRLIQMNAAAMLDGQWREKLLVLHA